MECIEEFEFFKRIDNLKKKKLQLKVQKNSSKK